MLPPAKGVCGEELHQGFESLVSATANSGDFTKDLNERKFLKARKTQFLAAGFFFRSASVHQCISASVHQCISASVHQCISAPWVPCIRNEGVKWA